MYLASVQIRIVTHRTQHSDEGNMETCNSTYQRSQRKTFLIYLTQISGCLFLLLAGFTDF